MLNLEYCTQCFVSICTYILIIFQYKITSVIKNLKGKRYKLAILSKLGNRLSDIEEKDIKLSSVDKPKNLVRFLEKQDC